MATSMPPMAGMPARDAAVRTARRWPASSRCGHLLCGLPQMQRAAAEQAEQSGNDQIDGDDVVEQPRHDQDEDAGKQRNDWRETEIHVHRGLLWRAPLLAFTETT